MVFATVASHNNSDRAIHGCWIYKVDKAKILIGIGYVYGSGDESAVMNVITIGF